MTQEALIKAADTIYWPLGGYSGASTVVSESEMADAILFNGPTWYASSLYTENGPYYLFDLTGLGYEPGQLYRVFNHKFQLEYSARAEVNGDNSEVFWGYLPEEQELVDKAPHGSRWFFLFDNPTGPQLSQFIIDRTADPNFTDEYIRSVIRKNAINQAYNALNEVFVKSALPFNLYTRVAPLESISTSSQVINHRDCIAMEGIERVTYFQPKHDTWLIATDPAGAPLDILDVDGIDNWNARVYTDDDGYKLLFIEARPRTTNVPISRMLGGLGTPIAANFSSTKLNVHITVGAAE
jgi:hypothetical protein